MIVIIIIMIIVIVIKNIFSAMISEWMIYIARMRVLVLVVVTPSFGRSCPIDDIDDGVAFMEFDINDNIGDGDNVYDIR